ncbi:scavenger receptor class F member 2-like isoform X2 [Haliotis rubra]|uniref:scavenger receptor class F member 2-like isoform X2 n=1 Tax=Haliotis rubra TaxID=36100 RepID=UPI001EE6221D|nr:scavenger receptor class F member 2-like isoform X2 [Haliotis rubra]
MIAGFPLPGIMDRCLNFNEVNKTCDCCRSGWTGQDCRTECPNCGSNYANHKCKTFCQNAPYYGTLCNIPCPAACLRNGQCNESCATHKESTKGSSSRTTDGALVTMAVCAVLFVARKYGVHKMCRKWLKHIKDKRGSGSGSSAESTPLTSDVKAADSSTQTEVAVAQPQAQFPDGGHSQNTD